MIDIGPWTFDRHLLLLKQLGTDEQPTKVKLDSVNMWVQVFDLPFCNFGGFTGLSLLPLSENVVVFKELTDYV